MFSRVFLSSQKYVSNKRALFRFLLNEGPFIGFIIKKQYGSAVVRNRLKNRARSLYRKLLISVPGVSVLFQPLVSDLSYADLKRCFKGLERHCKNL